MSTSIGLTPIASVLLMIRSVVDLLHLPSSLVVDVISLYLDIYAAIPFDPPM